MSKQMEENNMKNFSNYTDFDTKENLAFDSKVVHGALGTEPLTVKTAFDMSCRSIYAIFIRRNRQ